MCLALSEIKIESGSKLSSLPTSLTTDVRRDGISINIVVPYNLSLETMPECNYICEIPSDITEIEDSKFAGNTYINEVTIPANIKKIGESAFSGCENLGKVIFESGSQLTEIGEDAFYGCSSLTKIEIPESVITFGASCFGECTNLKTFTIYYHQVEAFHDKIRNGDNSFTVIVSDGVKKITEGSLSYAGLVSVIIPKSVEVIERGGFESCSKLNTVTFDANSKLTEIGEKAFFCCNELENIELPSKLTKIGPYAFYSCTSMEQINIPSGVTTIGESAFQGCTKLTTITLPSALKTLSAGCFADCTFLSSLELPERLEYIGSGILSGCTSLSEVSIPEKAEVEEDANAGYSGTWKAGHTFEAEWTTNETHHWHKAICIHPDVKGDFAYHDFVYDEITPATEDSAGTYRAHCDTCGYSEEITANGPYPATYRFTETVKVLPAGTTGSCGKTGTFVQFGDFPQSAAASGILFNPRPEDNGYYIGSDGNYYAKLNDVYYKVEPIKWRVCNTNFNGTGNALLFADNVLTAGIEFDKSYINKTAYTRTIGEKEILTNNYEYSFVRAYLNGLTYIGVSEEDTGKTEEDTTYTGKGLLQKAFTSEAQSLIQDTEVDNSKDSGTYKTSSGNTNSMKDDFAINSTTDKLLLLSIKEATDTNNGFAQYADSQDKERRLLSTDYARANNATNNASGAKWMCRNPNRTTVQNIWSFKEYGEYSSGTVDKTDIGIAPALCVSNTLLNQN